MTSDYRLEWYDYTRQGLVITGAASGIGAALARRFSEEEPEVLC